MKKIIGLISVILISIFFLPKSANAQQYKLKQVVNMMNMKMESTIYVKGMRKRTEGGGMMGMGANLATIEQCDLKRTIQLNDKKKLYFIQPFAQIEDEVINDKKTVPAKQKNGVTKKGGVITMWYNITDTGERKKMYGFTARHIWTSQKMKPSADACTMKDSMLIKTDGWYIDLPQFNCPMTNKPYRGYGDGGGKPECIDRFVTHSSGKGKLGFPLIQTTTMIMGDKTEVTTSIETIEFSTTKLDSMLFVIPPGYQLAKSPEELQDKMDMAEMMKAMNQKPTTEPVVNEQKKAGIIRIGVYEPTGNTEVHSSVLQKQMVNKLTNNKIEAVSVSSDEEARKLKCDYTLNSEFENIKPASKVGGILKAIKNADPNAATAYNIEVNLTLKNLNDATVKTQQTVAGKYDGRIDNAAGQSLDDGCEKILRVLR
jgi:hypothetical protein